MIQTLNEVVSSNMGGRCVDIATGLYVPHTTMEIWNIKSVFSVPTAHIDY